MRIYDGRYTLERSSYGLYNSEDLALGYEGKAVTEHIHFTVNKGDYLCIIGENGAGKSTLMKTLLRLIQPISGTIETGDGLSAYEVGYLPQQTAVQKDFPASVMEIVLTGTLNKSRLEAVLQQTAEK